MIMKAKTEGIMKKGFKIGVLISGRGSNMGAIADMFLKNIAFVGSNNPRAAGLQSADGRDIAIFSVDAKQTKKELGGYFKIPGPPEDGFSLDGFFPPDFTHEDLVACMKVIEILKTNETVHDIRARAWIEYKMLKEIEKYPPVDLLVLAGYMLRKSPYFIRMFAKEIMNIHPSLLPAFPGAHAYRDALKYGCKYTGITVHFVDASLDGGAIIGQAAFPILGNDTLKTLEARGLTYEHKLYPRCIDLFSEGYFQIYEQNGRKKVKGDIEII
jgi:formyltetrahydrofolate-dependent phosphoribosylglycinamide formyltransferase